ncbi:MAG: hypothetical protein LBQ00_02075, partial [Syntrophobacterales bacterium]|nr:hypothetical protein [Syntrophobacterales bacterium]
DIHIEEAAKTFKIGATTLKAWLKRYEETGILENRPFNGKNNKVDPSKPEAYDAYQSEVRVRMLGKALG